MIAAGPVVAGDVRIRRGVTAYLTLSSAFGKGEFRSAPDTGGSDTTTWNVVVQTSVTQCDLYEGWKEISSTPSVSEDTKDLSNTTRDTDVAVDVSGADIEIGDKVEVVIDGIPIPDDTGRFGPTTASGTAIQRPDGVARWFLEEVLGQTEDIIDLATYSGSGANYDANGIRLSVAWERLEEPDRPHVEGLRAHHGAAHRVGSHVDSRDPRHAASPPESNTRCVTSAQSAR
jgi:hypothetical protein